MKLSNMKHGASYEQRIPSQIARTLSKGDVSSEETGELLCKLQALVPGIPQNAEMSKLEIIQNVIDYIMALESALK